MTSASRALLTAALLALPSALAAQEAMPKSGTEVLERMRAAYDGKWYHTLTFAQKTTIFAKDGTRRVQSWREYMRHGAAGTHLRIDMGDPAAGNGALYTADSSWRFRAGKLAAHDADGNPFLPMIEGVYVQPVAKTVAEVGPMHVDLSKVTSGMRDGKAVWIVGVASTADSTSPQFWVEVERKVVVRMIVQLGGPDPFDIHLGDYVAVGGGMLATKVSMFVKGAPVQVEDYADWKVDVPIADAVFNPAAWVQPPR
ncbi:MAG: hypothetical protein ABIY52_10260 [Gemmatimonadaceae bacterium]